MSERFVSFDDMIGCAQRELLMRKRVYPRWVAAERMTQDKADQEIAFMAAILDHLLKAAGRREDNLLIDKKCPECGRLFSGTRIMVYCSAECSDKAAKRFKSKGNPMDGY